MTAALPNDILRGLYDLMSQTRALDKVMGAHDGHWHGLEGEEAIIAGVYFGLRPRDVVAPHYRGAVSASLAKGADLVKILAGCLGKSGSYNLGRFRSDVCGPPELGLIGLYSGSLGPPLGYAAGAALSAKLDGRDDIAIGSFGDGSSSRGDVHEAMNFAAVMDLPMIFVCQNNQIAISTDVAGGVAGSLVERAASYGMPSVQVDGNDIVAVRDAMDTATARARAGKGPSFIECLSYRVAGHFYSDAEEYRDPSVIAAWREKDPIQRFRAFLIAEGALSAQDLSQIDAENERALQQALDTALSAPPPGPEALGAAAAFAGDAA